MMLDDNGSAENRGFACLNVKDLFVSVRHPHVEKADSLTKSTFDKTRLLLGMSNPLINKPMLTHVL